MEAGKQEKGGTPGVWVWVWVCARMHTRARACEHTRVH